MQTPRSRALRRSRPSKRLLKCGMPYTRRGRFETCPYVYMASRISKGVWTVVIVAVLATGAFAYLNRSSLRDFYQQKTAPALPSDETYQPPAVATTSSIGTSPDGVVTESPSSPPMVSTEKRLAIPFISQAPLLNWDKIHEDTCEEASVIMVRAYYNKETSISPDEAERRL